MNAFCLRIHWQWRRYTGTVFAKRWGGADCFVHVPIAISIPLMIKVTYIVYNWNRCQPTILYYSVDISSYTSLWYYFLTIIRMQMWRSSRTYLSITILSTLFFFFLIIISLLPIILTRDIFSLQFKLLLSTLLIQSFL